MLSDQLATLEAYLALCADGACPLGPAEIVQLRRVMGGLADRAATLETALERTAELLSPRRDPGARAAREAAVASGKVSVLAAHRVARLPPTPGWTA